MSHVRGKSVIQSRFVRNDAEEIHKLRSRIYNRDVRKRPARYQDSRTESRAVACPCCNKRSNNCSADFSDVEPFFKKRRFDACAKEVYNSQLLCAADTRDGSRFIKEVRENAGEWPWDWTWGTCSIVRYFNNPELTDIFRTRGVISEFNVPKWSKMEKIIAARYAAGQTVFGGYYDAPVMTAFSMNGGKNWRGVKRMSSSKRDVLASRLIWNCRPKKELASYAESPSREAFANVYKSFIAATKRSVKSAMGPYQVKCTLDPMVIGGWFKQGHLSCWPEKCPGYKKGYKTFFPGMPYKHQLKALYFFHKQMKQKIPKLNFAESISHMCWGARRKKGVLNDSLDSLRKNRMLRIIADVIIMKQIMIVMTMVKVNPGESLTIVWAVKAGVAPSSLGMVRRVDDIELQPARRFQESAAVTV